jgi:hypothetical protein
MPRIVRIFGDLVVVLVLVATLWIVYRYTIGSKTLLWGQYDYAELLINYKAGLVRRGLIGAIVARLVQGPSSLKGLNTLLFFNMLVLTVCTLFMALVRGRYKGWTAALALLIPGGVLHMAISHEFFYRKEVFFYSFLAVSGVALSLLRPMSPGRARTFAARVLTVAILCGAFACTWIHEAFPFLVGPAVLFLLIASIRLASGSPRTEESRTAERRTAIWFGSVGGGLFLVSAVFLHGGAKAMVGIWYSLSPGDHAMMDGAGWGGIAALSAGVSDLWDLPLRILESGMSWWYVAPILLLFVFCFTLVALNLDDRDDGGLRGWLQCYGLIVVCDLPMLVLGYDWGRWVNAMSLSFLLTWLALREEDLFRPLDHLRLERQRAWLSKHGVGESLAPMVKLASGIVRRHAGAAVCLLLVFSVTFRLPEQILNVSNSFIGKSALEFVRSNSNGRALLSHFRH